MKTYRKNNLTFIEVDDFSIKYWDRNKRTYPSSNYINAGFFGYYKDNGVSFTLPAANLQCDIDLNSVSDTALPYLKSKLVNGRLRVHCRYNWSSQFKTKNVSTLVIPNAGSAYVDDLNTIPANAKYAISGVPTIRNGDDVDYYKYVMGQGWDSSCMYATYRNWLGLKGGSIYIISGKTETKNYIYGMEMYKKIKNENFDDVICLDGGGSYAFKLNNSLTATCGTRAVNSIISFS